MDDEDVDIAPSVRVATRNRAKMATADTRGSAQTGSLRPFTSVKFGKVRLASGISIVC
jgi:hypothetical protein